MRLAPYRLIGMYQWEHDNKDTSNHAEGKGEESENNQLLNINNNYKNANNEKENKGEEENIYTSAKDSVLLTK
jgi:hypothetical protein